ncbi:branched-chain-amino-acid transaminase [bacterium]
MLIYIDGKLVDKKDAKISVFDHGLLYGDGVFEGIRAYNKKIFRLDEHLDRLYDSARAIMLTIPLSKDEMKKAVIETVKANKISDGYIRVLVTRGEGDLGLDPANCRKASIIIIADIIELYPEELYKNGLAIITSSVRRNIPDALNPRIKSLNYLNNIMAKIEAKQNKVLEAVMLNNEGYVTEGTSDNIFIYKDGKLKTPPPCVGVLKGITRDVVMEIARSMDITVASHVFTQYELYTAKECFLTGTGAEIIPVVEIDQRTIGSGKPGKITIELIKKFRERVKNEGTEIY